MKQHVELLEQIEVAQRLQREMLVGPFRRGPLVEPETDDVGDDAPAALGRRVHQIIPALGHGGSAVAAVAVEVNFRSLQFDHRQGLVVLRLSKKAQDRIRRFTGNLIMLLSVPDFLSVERSGVPERIAKHLGQKIALHLGFVEFREAARTLQIGPFHQHGVGGFQLVLVEPLVFGRVLQKTRQDEAVRLGLTQRDHRIDGEEGFLSHFLEAVRALVFLAQRTTRRVTAICRCFAWGKSGTSCFAGNAVLGRNSASKSPSKYPRLSPASIPAAPAPRQQAPLAAGRLRSPIGADGERLFGSKRCEEPLLWAIPAER